MDQRQTLSYLRRLLEERNIRPKRRLGQNFLIDLNLIDLILRTAEIASDDLILEVGSGTGSFTNRLATQAGAVVTVEVDPAFATMTREAVADHENVTALHTDILRKKHELSPEVLASLSEARSRWNCKHLKLVANLPYAVATPVILNTLLGDLSPERMVVTLQWEIAEKLTAAPGTSDYGSLSVFVQSVADVELIRRLPPSVFWPRPKVASAIVQIRPNAQKRAQVGDVMRFRHFLRDLYIHRRKNLRSALARLANGRREKSEVDVMLAELALTGTIRAEDLDIEQHLRLCAAFAPTKSSEVVSES